MNNSGPPCRLSCARSALRKFRWAGGRFDTHSWGQANKRPKSQIPRTHARLAAAPPHPTHPLTTFSQPVHPPPRPRCPSTRRCLRFTTAQAGRLPGISTRPGPCVVESSSVGSASPLTPRRTRLHWKPLRASDEQPQQPSPPRETAFLDVNETAPLKPLRHDRTRSKTKPH